MKYQKGDLVWVRVRSYFNDVDMGIHLEKKRILAVTDDGKYLVRIGGFWIFGGELQELGEAGIAGKA